MPNAELSPLAEATAQRYVRTFAKSVPFYYDIADLHAIALLAAWKAEGRYDPTRRVPLEVWMKIFIHRALIEYLRCASNTGLRRSGRKRTGPAEHYQEPLSLSDFPSEDEDGYTKPLPAALTIPPFADCDGCTPELHRLEAEGMLDPLSGRLREIAAQYYVEGKCQAEIARSMGLSTTRLSQLVKRAHATLQESLQP